MNLLKRIKAIWNKPEVTWYPPLEKRYPVVPTPIEDVTTYSPLKEPYISDAGIEGPVVVESFLTGEEYTNPDVPQLWIHKFFDIEVAFIVYPDGTEEIYYNHTKRWSDPVGRYTDYIDTTTCEFICNID